MKLNTLAHTDGTADRQGGHTAVVAQEVHFNTEATADGQG